MSLKYELDSLEGVDESVSALYEKSGDKFRLKVEGVPQGEDVSGLKAKVSELLAESKESKRKAKEAEDAAQAAADEAARKGGNVEALEKSWKDKLSKREAELSDAIKSRDSQLYDLTVNAEARRIASDLAVPGSADVLVPHIKSRLKYEDGKLAVLDNEGKPSAMTPDELSKEIASNKAFAPLIVATHATGGGASGSKGAGGANLNRASMSPAEKREYIDKHGQESYLKLPKE